MFRNSIVLRGTTAMILFRAIGRRMIRDILARRAQNITINRILFLEMILVNLRVLLGVDCEGIYFKAQFLGYCFGVFCNLYYCNVWATYLPGKMEYLREKL